MKRICRPAIWADGARPSSAAPLGACLVCVVAPLAKALQVLRIEEQRLVAAVPPDVVNNLRHHDDVARLAHLTERLALTLPLAKSSPTALVVKSLKLRHAHRWIS